MERRRRKNRDRIEKQTPSHSVVPVCLEESGTSIAILRGAYLNMSEMSLRDSGSASRSLSLERKDANKRSLIVSDREFKFLAKDSLDSRRGFGGGAALRREEIGKKNEPRAETHS